MLQGPYISDALDPRAPPSRWPVQPAA